MLQGRCFKKMLGAVLLLASPLLLASQNECERTSVDRLQLLSPKKGYYQVEVEYCYVPETREPVFLLLALDIPEGYETYSHSFPHEVSPGRHSARLELNRPTEPEGSFNTYKLAARIFNGTKELAVKEQQQQISWPNQSTYSRQRMYARYSNDEILDRAEELIDGGDPEARKVARQYLEKIVLEEPDRVQVYKLFARIAMAEQWNDQGLTEARSHLDTALQIDPGYADGYILRGFVLAHLKYFDDAEADFRKAEALGVKNLWIWNNWAMKEKLQGNKTRAIELYRRTLASEKPTGRNLRARLNAFEHLLFFFDDGKHLDEMDALHQQRLSEFDERSCLYVEYAAFLLSQRQDYKKAIENGHKALDGGCQDQSARRTLGIAYHIGSLQEPSLIGRARVFQPEGPELYWGLAQVPQSEALLKRYKSNIDSMDGQGHTALTYALEHNNFEAAQRLMSQGASLDLKVGVEKYPLSLLPIFRGSAEGVRFAIDQGIDYGHVEYQGTSALDYAQQAGNQVIIELLKGQQKI